MKKLTEFKIEKVMKYEHHYFSLKEQCVRFINTLNKFFQELENKKISLDKIERYNREMERAKEDYFFHYGFIYKSRLA